MKQLPPRLHSIDVFRAITMLLMVFVNDVDAVHHIPEWIKHVPDEADGLGFADTIFPAFLFIVGLSLPFALNHRLQKGMPLHRIAGYIATRSLALLVMGFFHVNLESYNEEAAFPMPVWEFSITIAFFLIWLDYAPTFPNMRRYLLQATGVVLLLLMAFLYRGGKPEAPEPLQTSWWGILGLIGWAYLTCSLIYLFSKGRFWVQVLAALFFFGLCVAAHAGWVVDPGGIRDYVWPSGSGSMAALTMLGVVVSCLYLKLFARQRMRLFGWLLVIMGIGAIVTGFVVRPFGGISKVHDTPAWVGICGGISILVFGGLIWLIDVKQKQRWFHFIRPAGTSTLTCYLLPYFLYAILYLLDFKYPEPFDEGMGGLIRSVILAFLMVRLTGWLEKRRLRLQI